MADLASTHTVWREAFPKDSPANTFVGVNGPLQLPGCRIALDLVGYIPS